MKIEWIFLSQLILFTLYILYYWKSGVKSISMSSYQNGNWSLAGFTLFMIGIAIPFATLKGNEILGFDAYQIAAGFLVLAGLSHRHQEHTIKQIHHIVSTLAILFGFIGLGSWIAVGIFIALLIPSWIWGRKRFLWWLEIDAFYIIWIFEMIDKLKL